MARIYPHKKSGWQIHYRVHFPDGTVKAKIKYAMKKQDAHLIVADVEHLEAMSRKRHITKDEVTRALNLRYLTVEEASRLAGARVSDLRTWNEVLIKYEDWSRDNCRTTTHDANMPRVSKLVSDLENGPGPAEFTVADVEAYLAKREKKGMKSATRLKDLVTLRKLLDYIDPDNNPAREVPLPKIDDEKTPRVLSREEVLRFFEILEEFKHLLYGHLKRLVMIYLYAGLRPSEIINLRLEDIRNGLFYIEAKKDYKTKTGKARTVEINRELEPILKDLKGPYICGGERKLDSRSVSRAIRKLYLKAKIHGVTPYSLRHSFATYMLTCGATLEEVRQKLGHTRIATTAKYLHMIPDIESTVHKLSFGSSEKSSG